MRRIGASLLVASLPALAIGSEIDVAEQLAEGGAAVVVILGLSILFLAVTIERGNVNKRPYFDAVRDPQ